MNLRELVDDIRETLDNATWSKAVLCVRHHDVAPLGRQQEIHLFDVMMGDTQPYRVELDLDTGDWSCSCRSADDACAHAAAAVLYLYQKSKARGKDGPAGRMPGAHVGFRFSTAGRTWKLDAVRVSPGDPVQESPIRGGDVSGLTLDRAEQDALALIEAGLAPRRATRLLWALSRCRDVTLDGTPVNVSPRDLPLVLVVEDHPNGVRARLTTRDRCHYQLERPFPLVVTGTPPTLSPLAYPDMPEALRELYEAGRIVPFDAIPAFFTEALPELRRHVEVVVRAHRVALLNKSRPYPNMTIAPAPDGFDVLVTVAYGSPPQAVVVGTRLVRLEGARGVPRRDLKQEQRIARHIERLLGVPPGRRVAYRDVEAARFAAEILPRFRGHVSGRQHVERFRLAGHPLVPRWVAGAETEGPELVFEVNRPDDAGGPGPGKAETARKGGWPAPSRPGDPTPSDPAGDLGPAPRETSFSAMRASPQEVLDAWREGRSLVSLEGGGYARLPEDWMDRYGMLLEALLDPSLAGRSAVKQPIRARLLEAAPLSPDMDRIRRALLEATRVPPVSPPQGLHVTLRPYQREGLAWLTHLERQEIGGILADDMGLGKTIQTLARILLTKDETGPTLVVAPTSVIENWASEAARVAPALCSRVYHGPDRSLERLDDVDVVITSYAILRRDLAHLGAIAWHRVVLDEAQAIKNPDSQTARAARALRADHRLALTGTPIENRLEELWSLLEFLNPGLLGSLSHFEDRYVRPLRDGENGAMERLRIRVQPFILRRMKKDVERDLPPKTDMVLKPRFTAKELEVYEAIRRSGQAKVMRVLEEKGLQGGKVEILRILLRLRQACCHPALVPGSGFDKDYISTKVALLLEQIQTLREEGHRALVFSQWTSYLDILEHAFAQRGLSWVRLDGSTRDRKAVVARFQAEDGPEVFLISLKAGGTGLNLTAADYVFHVDPWWNPAVEAQATDRAHRIGQTRPVVVYRLVMAGSVEERVMALQARKRATAEAALRGSTDWIASLSPSEVEALLEP